MALVSHGKLSTFEKIFNDLSLLRLGLMVIELVLGDRFPDLSPALLLENLVDFAFD